MDVRLVLAAKRPEKQVHRMATHFDSGVVAAGLGYLSVVFAMPLVVVGVAGTLTVACSAAAAVECVGLVPSMMHLLLTEVAATVTPAYAPGPAAEPAAPVLSIIGIAPEVVAAASEWLAVPAVAHVLAPAFEWSVELALAVVEFAFAPVVEEPSVEA